MKKSLNLLKYNEKRENKLIFSERGNHEFQKECYNGENINEQNIYASMTRMSDNEIFSSRYFGDSSQLTR